ncbi:MAG: NUDIX hydrolase [Clostridiales bacterium]|jgi:ADP-ribose pyrophosphatase|nr:NUDIX hydrolase [Clostridiales bacterium]
MAYETIRSERVFNGILIDIYHDVIRLPDGRETVREIVRHSPAAAILPIDADGKLILVRQYRHAVNAMTLEIPAGILEKGEDPAAGAARELEEETGKKAGRLTFIFKFYSSIGYCDEDLSVYIAEDLISTAQNLDDDEFVTIERYSPDEVFQMIIDGKIIDSKTTAAALYYIASQRR